VLFFEEELVKEGDATQKSEGETYGIIIFNDKQAYVGSRVPKTVGEGRYEYYLVGDGCRFIEGKRPGNVSKFIEVPEIKRVLKRIEKKLWR
jgi:hypothetical protein